MTTRSRTTRLLFALVLALVLSGCLSGDDEADPTQAVPPSATVISSVSAVTPTVPSATATATVTATATATQPPPSPTPQQIPVGQEEDLPDVDLAYRIDGRLRDVERGIVDALSVVTITSRESDPLDHLYFRVVPAQFNEFSLNRLTRDGVVVDPVGSDNGTTLEVPIDPPLMPGATTELTFDFAIPLRDPNDGFASVGIDGQVMRLGVWYPMLSNDEGYPPLLDPPYTLAADYTVSFTAPADVVVAASGELTGPPIETTGGVRYDYALTNGRDFSLMLSTEYEVDERTTASGIVVRQYTLASQYGDSDLARAAIRDRAFAVAEQSLAEFAARIGPYPWPSLALVEAGPGLGGGIEYSALTIISYDSGSLDNLIAHEIAHQWFYGVIGTRTQDDPWIDEGAATFLGNGITNGDYTRSSDQGVNDYIAPLGASIAELDQIGGDWVGAIYSQGGSFYADLLIDMGEDDFWAAMQDIYTTQRFGIATAWEVLTTFEAHSDSDLDALYERYFAYEWLDDVR